MKKLIPILLAVVVLSSGCDSGLCVSGDCENGYGTYTYASGDKFVGEWKDGKKHGQGTHTFPDGTVQEGLWEYGYFIK